MPAAPHILLAGGGKAGNLHPGLAIADHLRRRIPGVELTFAGDGRARERHTVRCAGYRYATVPAQPAPQSPLQALRFVTDNAAGYVAARWLLREQQVSAVVGLGGCTCTSVVRAAVARGVPVSMLEQNAVPSRTTRWLSSTAAAICGAYDEIRPHLDVRAHVLLTGNPARPEFEQLYRSRQARQSAEDATEMFDSDDLPVRAQRPRRLVVLGGAGGARSLNEQMPRVLKQLAEESKNWHIVHQTGEGQLFKLRMG
jgi:UDP-N-acetylglucosamine--N-acetylmuramyl-(pentapeptide) pyrophosphoryl-undecaprenol N-acetylglucosamine transferase